jgi:mono/diheme cytochrome c family protein
MRYFFFIFGLCILAVMGVLGKRGSQQIDGGGHFRKPPLYIFPDMERQLKLRPQKENGFFTNGLSSQLPVPGTVARSAPLQTATAAVYPFEDSPVNSGHIAGTTNFIENNPMPITIEFLKRGQQRFNINCSPCHSAIGDGKGITQKIGAMAVVADLHQKRIVEMADGEIFSIITNGRNLMGAYGPNVDVKDRWAIVAYLRALQIARLGAADDLPPDARAKLK